MVLKRSLAQPYSIPNCIIIEYTPDTEKTEWKFLAEYYIIYMRLLHEFLEDVIELLLNISRKSFKNYLYLINSVKILVLRISLEQSRYLMVNRIYYLAPVEFEAG